MLVPKDGIISPLEMMTDQIKEILKLLVDSKDPDLERGEKECIMTEIEFLCKDFNHHQLRIFKDIENSIQRIVNEGKFKSMIGENDE